MESLNRDSGASHCDFRRRHFGIADPLKLLRQYSFLCLGLQDTCLGRTASWGSLAVAEAGAAAAAAVEKATVVKELLDTVAVVEEQESVGSQDSVVAED